MHCQTIAYTIKNELECVSILGNRLHIFPLSYFYNFGVPLHLILQVKNYMKKIFTRHFVFQVVVIILFMLYAVLVFA